MELVAYMVIGVMIDMNKYTYEELKKWTKWELCFWVSANISPFVAKGKSKKELIKVILIMQ